MDTLLGAARDQDQASGRRTTADALNTLWHADPAHHGRRRHILLRRILTSLGTVVLERAHLVARDFLQDRGGHLADPTVRRAAQSAMNTYDKFIYANTRVTGLLDEGTYLQFLTQLIVAVEDVELASRYTTIP